MGEMKAKAMYRESNRMLEESTKLLDSNPKKSDRLFKEGMRLRKLSNDLARAWRQAHPIPKDWLLVKANEPMGPKRRVS